jgi:hypothetical protein
MLSVVRSTLIGGLAIASACSIAARADDKSPVVVVGDNNSGVVSTTVTAPGTAVGEGSQHTSESSSSDNGVTCSWTAESERSQEVWQWLGSDPNGTWYDVRCSDGSVYLGLYVPPAASNLPPAVALAGSLAKSAANRLVLPAPLVRHNPAGRALVGLSTWWWVDPRQWSVLRQRTEAGPVWAEVAASPITTTWDAGDGTGPLVCDGPGTPYDTTMPEAPQRTSCSHTYRRTSADQPQTGPSVNDRYFTVTVTTTWRVTWRGSSGSGGTLPALTTTSRFPLAVAQRQTVVTGGSG